MIRQHNTINNNNKQSMELKFAKPNTTQPNNKITRIKHSLAWVPLITIVNYFRNYENIYFLFLAMFQLSTLWLLPCEWSPTGPFSTIIPLLVCILIEIISNVIKWHKDWKTDFKENNQIYKCIDEPRNSPNSFGKDESENICDKTNQNLYPGEVIHLVKDDICPVDGILVDTTNNEKYSKISLALLNGESNINYVVKPCKYFKLKDYVNSRLIIDDYHTNDFHNIDGTLINGGNKYEIKRDNFIVAGSIIKSDDVYIWITACGENKKSFAKEQINNPRKLNRLDDFVANYMMKVNTLLLAGLILVNTTIKLLLNGISCYNIIFYMIQNWILFNGIIPFSVKIFLIMARSIQGILHNKNSSDITINNTSQIDDIGKITKILTDKTGTLTKNELEFCKLIENQTNHIIDIDTYGTNYHDISKRFHECLGLCIHQTESSFCTAEDKTLRNRYQYLNNTINQIGSQITLVINNNQNDYKYIDIGGLDFTFERRMSSKIVKDQDGKCYIYCKGALNAITNKVKDKYKNEINRLDNLISQKHPELRLLACAYRLISQNEIDKLTTNSVNQSAMVASLEDNLDFIGLVGIRDNLQDGVKETINRLNNFGIDISLLTGDRKITAVAISKEAGFFDNENDIFDFTLENKYEDVKEIKRKTLMFSGQMLEVIAKDPHHKLFSDYLIKCKNFVGYNLIPEHKRILTKILETDGIRTLTIGDGFNDIGMFNTSSVSVAIKGNAHVENNADFSIKEFRNLSQLFDQSFNSYYRNSKLINLIFYRCAAVIFSILTFSLINYNQTVSLFNGFVIQAFNFAWIMPAIAYYTLSSDSKEYNKNDYLRNTLLTFTSDEYTNLWNFGGMATGILLVLLNYYWFSDNTALNDVIALSLICLINCKIVFNNKPKLYGVLLACFGVMLFVLYTLIVGSFVDIFDALYHVNKIYWLTYLGIYIGVSFLLI